MKSLSVQTLFVSLFLYLFLPSTLFSQAVSDTLALDEITVQSTRFDTEKKHQPISVTRFSANQLDVYGSGDISAIIERRSSAMIRNYGPGGLSNLSMRGYSPGRTQVVWNNFNLNDPVNGVFDLSLMPANFIQSMELSAGNSSTAYGSSAAGGTLYLDSGAGKSQYSGWQTFGSYGQNIQGIKASQRFGNWHAGLALQREGSDNDYDYQFEGETQSRVHNRVEGLHGMLNAGYQTDDINIQTTLWLYGVENESPGSLYFPSESAVQDDRALRSATGIEYKTNQSVIYSNIIYSDADTDYTDPAFGIESETNIKSFSNEVGWKQQWLKQLKTDQSVTFSVNRVESTNFEQNESQFYFAYRLNTELNPTETLRLFGGLRYDYYEVAGDAVSGSLGANYRLLKDLLILKGQWSRNFVSPTLNDLFWPNGGNPDLEPETNHKFEGGLISIYEYGDGFGRLETEAVGFFSRQMDGIQWLFGSEGLSVRNVNEIETSGIELSVRKELQFSSKLRLHAELGSDYTKAIVSDDEMNPDTEGDQLVYVPEWSHRAHLKADLSKFSMGADFRYIGDRYTTQDNSLSDPLNSYRYVDLFAQVRIPFNSVQMKLSGRVQNVTDQEFQFIDGYPMPGRTFLMTARFNFIP
jgi:vitamin B12 transporter